MTNISIIACIGRNRELGRNNDLIWKIPADMQYFKKITMGHPVIMGEKTFNSIGKPLSGRLNIVLSKNKNLRINSAIVAHSLDEAIDEAEKSGEEIFFIGGANVYEQAIPLADKLYLTVVDDSKSADVYFPDYSQFKDSKKVGEGIFDGVKYKMMIFQR